MPVPLSETYGKSKSPYRTTKFKIELTRLTSVWPRRVFIQWILRKPTSNVGYSFKVYRSHNYTGPWTLIDDTLLDTYYYMDNDYPAPFNSDNAGLHSMRMSPYYKVTVEHPNDGVAETIAKVESAPDRRRKGMITKLRRDARVAIQKGNGTEVAILKRRWYGEPCSCRASTGQSTRAKCSICLGTGVELGYWDPVYGFASRSATPVIVNTAIEGKTEQHAVRSITEYIPEIIPDDVIVFLRDNRRFIVLDVTTTEIQTVNVHQELTLSELARSGVEYNITADHWHTPPWF